MRDTRWFEIRGLRRLEQGSDGPNWSGLFQSTAFSSLPLDFRGLAAHDPTVQIPDPTIAVTSYSLTPSNTTVTEGNTSITFTITRSGDKPAQTIYASTLFDTARSPGDYDGLVNFAVSFSSGQTSRTFTVDINEDTLVEATEHFRVMIGDDTSDGSAQALDISDVFITDDDAPVGTTYTLTPASTTVTEGNTSITFTVTRTGNTSSSATIYASTLFDTASSPGDYDGLVNRVVSFAANDPTETFTVSIKEDSLVESTEHFRVMIGDDTSDGSAQALDISDVFITDDDTPTGTTYSLTPGSTTVVEGNTLITFTVTRTGNTSSSATIYASTLFDTASSPGDYVGRVNHVVSFAQNDPTETFTVSINEDSLVEATEHFRVMIGDDTTDGSAQALDISDVFITDNDGTTFTITPASTSVTEGSQLVFTITRTGNLGDQTVFFSAWKDTASFEAGDYSLTGGGEPLDYAIHFVANDPTETVTLSILQDGQADAGERFRAIVQGNPPASDPAVNLAQTPFITINEGPAQNTVYELTPSDTSVTEGGQVIFTIRRLGDKPDETIYFSTLADGTATYGEHDYSTTSGGRPENIPVHFTLGQEFWSIALDIQHDGMADAGEYFRSIIQRDDQDLTSVFLDRSDYVTITEPQAADDDEEAGWFFGIDEYIPTFVHVAQAADDVIHLAGFRYPVSGSGVVNEHTNDGDHWSIAQDLGTRYYPPNPAHPSHAYYHLGEDWNSDNNEIGESAKSVRGGYIVEAIGNHPGFGNVVVIAHFLPDMIVYSLYAHLANFAPGIVKGATIESGRDLGLIGNSGLPGTPVHLHFEMFSMESGTSLDDYLGNSPPSGHYGYTHDPSGVFSESPSEITNYSHYSEGGFTWYNPSMFIDHHKEIMIATNGDVPTTSNVFARNGDAVISFIQEAKEVILSWFEEIRIVGGNAIDSLKIGSLFGTTIDHNTIYFDGGAGNDKLDGALADRRIVAEGGVDDDGLIGGTENDLLDGGDGNDTLTGGGGTDNLIGGAGDDVFLVDDLGDQIVEAAGGGRDVVFAVASYRLSTDAEVEIFSTIAHDGATAMDLTGNAFAQEIWGNAGANILAGGGGADSLIGGGGNDIYIADSDDMVFEKINEGADTVFTSASYVLSSNQEIETLSTQTHAGTENVFLTGNQYNNTLIGNAGDNILNGVDGADVMYGLAGNDTYAIDNLGDLVIDGFGQGTDLVLTYLSHTLSNGNEIETLSTVFHQGTTAIDLGGNDYNNTLIGNYGANYLNGNGGVDVMIGLNGNDIYVADNAGDVVQEAVGGGSDLLYSFVSYALAAGQEVEAISTAVQGGTAAIALTGNEYAQTIAGNAGANFIDGKGGSDVLYGFAGADTFAFTTALGAGNVDAIADFAAGTDKIGLDDAIFTAIGGSLGAGAFVIGSGATDANDRIIYNSATGQLFYDADGNGGGAAVQFATLATGLALTAGDFTMI